MDLIKSFGLENPLTGKFLIIPFVMLMLGPFVMLGTIAVGYGAIAFGFASLRPVSIAISCAAILELKGYAPTGHIVLWNMNSFGDKNFDWTYCALYSSLPLLGTLLLASGFLKRHSGNHDHVRL
jgi:hypothetical protein